MTTVAYFKPKQPNVFYKKGVLKHFTKFIEKLIGVFLMKLQT